MPKQKDLKRVIRTRMQKTGESYTAARAHIVTSKEEKIALAALAGMADASIAKGSGHGWKHWVGVLDSFGDKNHAAMARHIDALGIPSWWSQSVVVGYERIRGLRARGQRRSGTWAMNKSRTFAVPVVTLFEAWANSRRRKKWMPEKVTVRTATASKTMRLTWEDGTVVSIGFLDKGARSAVAVQHEGLGSKAEAERLKKVWSERFDSLAAIL